VQPNRSAARRFSSCHQGDDATRPARSDAFDPTTAHERPSAIFAALEGSEPMATVEHVTEQLEPIHTAEERAATGKAARAEVPRSAHAVWEPSGDRPDPVELLEQQAASRVPELVPLRYGRMLVSPFTFFRGAAYPMAADLAESPRSGLEVQLCGDAHLSNFGAFAAPDRRLVFGLNDFDETLPGPFEWDVKRLAASLVVLARDNGLSEADARQSVSAAYRGYATRLREYAKMPGARPSAAGWRSSRPHAGGCWSAHTLRSGDAAAINAYLGASAKVEQAFVAFASAYADQNERGHAQFARAVEQGSIPSAVGWGERR
jgi:hypothetical protein